MDGYGMGDLVRLQRFVVSSYDWLIPEKGLRVALSWLLRKMDNQIGLYAMRDRKGVAYQRFNWQK